MKELIKIFYMKKQVSQINNHVLGLIQNFESKKKFYEMFV